MAKILINYTGRTAGGAAHAYMMTKSLIEAGADVYVIISRQADNYKAWKALPAKKILAIDTYTNKREFVFRTLQLILYRRFLFVREFKGINFTAIYVPMGTYWSYVISNLFPKVPVYYTIHDPKLHSGESLFNRFFHKITCYEISKAHKIITLSQCFVKEIMEIYKKAEEDVIVIPQSAFWEYKLSHSKRDIVNYDSNKVNFLFFGRIEDYKGLDLLLIAYEKLEREFPNNVSLTIAGKGSLAKYAESIKRIKNKNVLNYMIPDEQIASLFGGKKIVTVLPYKDATQSGVINTAFMFNSLVIASNVGAIPYQLNHGDLGVLLDKNDVTSLYNAMHDVVAHYEEYKVYIERAKSYIDELKWDNLALKLLNQIEE